MPRSPQDKRKLDRSPLVLVLSEVKFSPVLTIGSTIPAIQDALRRKGFPAFNAASVQQIQFALGGNPTFQQSQRWIFTSEDGSRAITLTTEGLSYQTTDYEDFETFLDTVADVVQVVAGAVEPSFAGRIGLRYVDAVPNIGDGAPDYFNETVRTFSASDLNVRSLLSSQHILATTDVGHLQIRMNQVENSPLLPPDLNTPELGVIGAPKDGVHAILDIDSSDEGRSEFGWGAIEARLWAVHAHASTAFWKSITDNARRVWGERPVQDAS